MNCTTPERKRTAQLPHTFSATLAHTPQGHPGKALFPDQQKLSKTSTYQFTLYNITSHHTLTSTHTTSLMVNNFFTATCPSWHQSADTTCVDLILSSSTWHIKTAKCFTTQNIYSSCAMHILLKMSYATTSNIIMCLCLFQENYRWCKWRIEINKNATTEW